MQVRVGGPACEGTNTSHIGTLLDHCYNGTNAATGTKGTKIDFVTYHWYADNVNVNPAISGTVLNANNSAAAHKMVVNLLKSYPLFTGQIFEDEMGPSYNPVVQRDMQQNASWLAKSIHLLNEGGAGYPPPVMFAYWTLSDIYEENMIKTSNLSFQEGNYGMLCRGTASYPNSWDIEKPVFQAYRLLHKLGDFELSSSGGITSDGVNLVATCNSDNNAIQILIYSHFASQSQNSGPTDNITLTVNNIPWTGSAKVETFLSDTTHSNTYTAWVSQGKPGAPSNAQWDVIRQASYLAHYDSVATTPLTGSTFTKSNLQLHYYGVMLVVLSNPSVSIKTIQDDGVKSAASIALHAEISGNKMLLTFPGSGQFNVHLYSTIGRTIFKTSTNGSGSISLAKVPAGAYMLECSGSGQKLVKAVFIGK